MRRVTSYGRRKKKFIAEENKCPICEGELYFARFQHIASCADQVGTEHAQQVAAFEWLKTQYESHPVLRLTHAIPNGGLRATRTAILMRREGVTSGVPDVALRFGRRGYVGMSPEFKVRGKKPTTNQAWWLDALWAENTFTFICYHWTEFRDAVLWYIGESENEPTSWPQQKAAASLKKARAKRTEDPAEHDLTLADAARLLASGEARVGGRRTKLDLK